MGKSADASKLPRIFYVNWFRRDESGKKIVWPGFGENSRVLKWVVDRIEGNAAAEDTAIGRVPSADQIDLSGLDTPREDVDTALHVDVDEWKAEIPLIEEWFATIGADLPSSVQDEFDALKQRLGVA